MELNLVWENCQKLVPIGGTETDTVKQCILAALAEEEFAFDAEVNLFLVNNEEIRRINREQREIDRVTDVLSFPMLEQENGETVIYDEDFVDGRVLLGDIVISAERAKEQAEAYGHSFLRELGFLTVHSLLHLLGYDHETSEEEEKEMFEKQEKILRSVGLTR